MQTIKANKEETTSLMDRTLRILVVVVTSARNTSSASEKELSLSPDLKYKIDGLAELVGSFASQSRRFNSSSLLRNLESILEDLKKLSAKTNSKGLGGFFKSATLSNKNTEEIKKLNQRLDREMNIFQVSPPDTFIR